MKDLFENVHMDDVLLFLKETRLYWKYRFGYNPENTTNWSTESKLLLNRNTIMFVLIEIVVRKIIKKKNNITR